MTGPQGETGAQGPAGANGREIVLRANEACATLTCTSATPCNCVQWAYDEEDPNDMTWADLMTMESLQGPQGIQGQPGTNGTNGTNGREIELRVKAVGPSNLYCGVDSNNAPLAATDGDACLQWRYTSGNDQSYHDLINLTTMTGGGNGGRSMQVQQCSEAPAGKRAGHSDGTCLAELDNDNDWANVARIDFGALAYKNTVDTADIEDDAVTTAKIANGTILEEDLNADLQKILTALKKGQTNGEFAVFSYDPEYVDQDDPNNKWSWKKVETGTGN